MAKKEVFLNVPIPIVALLASLDDDTLAKVSAAVYVEKTERMNKKLDAGEYEPLTEYEENLVRDRQPITAIREYRDRTQSDLCLAKAVVDRFVDKCSVIDAEAVVNG